MASSRVMPTSNSRNSDLSRLPSVTSSSSSSKPSQIASNHLHQSLITPDFPSTMGVDGILHNVYASNTSSSESTLLDAQITLIDTPAQTLAAAPAISITPDTNASSSCHRTAEDVWREIVSGERKEMKDEAADEMMTLEDFLAKAGAVEEEDVVNIPPTERLSGGVFAFDAVPQSTFQQIDKVEGSVVAFGNGTEVIGGGRGKRGRAAMLEPLDKAAQQRQRRMIKNRESAARSRERKQAHQVELETLAARLEEENERLLKEKAERTKESLKQLKEKIIPVLEKKKPKPALRRVCSMEW